MGGGEREEGDENRSPGGCFAGEIDGGMNAKTNLEHER